MKKILVIGRAFPHASHGYINNDIEYLSKKANVLVLSPNQPMAPFYSPINLSYFSNEHDLIKQARQFKPDFIVSWVLPNHFFARNVADALNVPFVIKLHTPDYHALYAKHSFLTNIKKHFKSQIRLSKSYQVLRKSVRETAESKNLIGVYCIAAFKDTFSEFFPKAKIFDLKPRIPYQRYHDNSPNGTHIIVLGALSNTRDSHFSFNKIINSINAEVDWYPIPTPGFLWTDLPDLPSNLHIMKYVPPTEMPKVYKKYKALVMIGSGMYSRGLSLSALEAQASGVTVVAPSLRPDFDEFIVNGGGFIFKNESEIPEILTKIPDQSRREAGFINASQYDIAGVEDEFAKAGIIL